MAAYIPRKIPWLKWLLSVFSSSAITLILCFLLNEPYLGPLYDFLLEKRPAVPVAREILIIDAGSREFGEDILEPGAASTLIYILSELGAGALIVQLPILGHAAGGTTGEAEIIHYFDEEFSILSQNIRNLFDAIRLGSIAPRDSARFVGELVELSEQGKERLVSALILRDMEGILNLERAAAFFGNVSQPKDVRVQLIRASDRRTDFQEDDPRPGLMVVDDAFSQAIRDADGILRRVMPVMTEPDLSSENGNERILEHIIYRALKTRFPEMHIAHTERGMSYLAADASGEWSSLLPLDTNGALLFELPKEEDDFRRISISEFLAYDEADRNLRRILSDVESLGFFRNIDGENRPDFLYDFAFLLREEYSTSGEAHGRQIWVEARNRYFSALEDFLSGPTEMLMVRNLEYQIAQEYSLPEYLDSSAFPQSIEERDILIGAFAALRASHEELIEIRRTLESALFDSFCILGRASYTRPHLTDAEASALLANSIITGRVIRPVPYPFIIIASMLSSILIIFILRYAKALSALFFGSLLTLFSGGIFSVSFILTGYWLSPLIPMASGFTVVLIAFFWALSVRSRYSKNFRIAYGPYVSKSILKSIIRGGKPQTNSSMTIRAAVVGITNLDKAIDDNSPLFRTRLLLTFQETASELFKKAGGTIIGMDDKTLLVCFGSPLERVYLEDRGRVSPYNDNNYAMTAPARKAIDVLNEIVKHPKAELWQFGLDLGNCNFAWSPQSGYFALGDPVQKAKALSRSAGRFKYRVLLSGAISDALPDLAVRKLNVFKNKDGSQGDYFYGLNIVD